MSITSRITEVVQAYHDDNFSDRDAMDSAAGDMFYEICEKWGLDYPDDAMIEKFENLMRPLISESVDWQEIADADQDAREWDEARRDAIYGQG